MKDGVLNLQSMPMRFNYVIFVLFLLSVLIIPQVQSGKKSKINAENWMDASNIYFRQNIIN